ncbi:ATP-dependent zinc protease family protein [Vibrio metschnikovii]|uniref:ATP-dependent zinc protease family protein n=1 Tax=Vibrio metschnikovii TaxID=28172 RepID=UPI0001B95357|nr:ATP-dependent zinc protease [Vibrio metschnikovii]EEX35970.1 hypothetical protein VIB_002282 [Vibrio metschnikovii CIP 69.14]MBC3616268.1 ATP-dependent zinc protease [Vibrio metschnikovii]MBC5812280.1 ATP-dependent zinc protease [Vibrio metschnikovii]MDA3138447.1 ATP-dependent zinc protease [Vibrio metschnikovii]SUP49495.1 ATP-dependent Zn protease - hypothetical lipoprotein [Vibrio metschnikovii]
MKQPWKILLTLLLSGGLVACAMVPSSEQTETSAQIEQPEPETESAKPEVEPEPPEIVEPEVPAATKTSDGKLIFGEKEWVYVPAIEESFRARIDTGATTSSISAVDVEAFERDGEDWVKFRIEHDGIKSGEINLPVERWVRIRQSSDNSYQRRPVVMMWVQLGEMKDHTQFTLANRTHLTFPILLGRSFFRDVAVVDVSREYVQGKHQ